MLSCGDVVLFGSLCAASYCCRLLYEEEDQGYEAVHRYVQFRKLLCTSDACQKRQETVPHSSVPHSSATTPPRMKTLYPIRPSRIYQKRSSPVYT